MCCSFLGQIVYGALMVAAVGLTLASMFSPGWTDIKNKTSSIENDLLHLKLPENTGIFPFLCQVPGQAPNVTNTADGKTFDYCANFWESLPTWEKAVVAGMCLALVVEVLAVITTLVSICACCFKQIFVFALPILALLASIFLAIAVVVFGIYNKDFLGDVNMNTDLSNDVHEAMDAVKEGMQSEAGYSFYLAVAALVATVVDIVVGAFVKCMANRCC